MPSHKKNKEAKRMDVITETQIAKKKKRIFQHTTFSLMIPTPT
jgi:hypothetical protein